MRVVFDTNVVVSALLKPRSHPADALMAAIQGHVTPLFDDRILDEYREVLARPKFRFDRDVVLALVTNLRAVGEVIDVGDPAPRVQSPDPNDVPFIEVAVAGAADAIVTGNQRHFLADIGIAIVSPGELVDMLRQRGVTDRG